MVSWTDFVRLGFRVADGKGGEFEGIDEGAEFITALSMLWNEDKQRLRQMTEQQVVNYLQQRVQA